jgi:hypothetical protein
MSEKIWYWDRKSYQEYQNRERKAYKNLFAIKEMPETDAKDPLMEYPLNTIMAASELKRRGIDCNAKQLAYMASKGIVQPDGGGNRGADFRWSAELIDKVAEIFGEEESLTPYGQMCLAMNLNFGQVQHAFLTECEKISRDAFLNMDITQLKMVIHPAKNAGDEYATVEFFAPDAGKI